ncbi:MAG: cytidine deaminase [Clostridiales bacterium]|nr:cytidine deaminase [Clostridiales bacterium]
MTNAELLQLAVKAKENSYSPYSKFRVGAALLCENGKVYSGSNVENASIGATVCAERVAILKAISSGERNFKKIAISVDSKNWGYPCGICLQVMTEFCGDDFKIVVANRQNEHKELKLKDVLPNAFRKKELDGFIGGL